MALRRCALRLAGGQFPVRPEGRDKLEKGKEFADARDEPTRFAEISRVKEVDGAPTRGSSVSTKTVDGKKEMSTFFTQDGGRVDFVDIKWPPEHLEVRSVPVEEVRVKFGTPWPSLYPALNVFNAEVSVRYVMDSSFKDMAALGNYEGARCPLCVSEAQELFKPLQLDEEVKAHLRKCVYAPIPAWKYWLYSRMIDFGVYRYSAASMLGISKLYLVSREQVKDLMGDMERTPESCLDIGAGSGDVTDVFKDVLEGCEFTTTEVSERLVKDLKKKGYDAYLTDSPTPRWLNDREYGFDAVLLLNVLDRCSSLTRLLDEAVYMTNPGGRLVLSLPLPLRQVQHRLGKAQELLWPPPFNKPCAWEHAAAWFANYILDRYAGVLKLKRVARAPYISNGPARAPINVLDTAIFVFDKTKNPCHQDTFKDDWSKVSRDPLCV